MRKTMIFAMTIILLASPAVPFRTVAGETEIPSVTPNVGAVTTTSMPTKQPNAPMKQSEKTGIRKKSVDKPRAKTEAFKVTAYCPCEECSCGYGRQTATGNTARAGHTIAVDPTVIKYGTHVKISGVEYVAEDCGGAVKGNTIDIFFDTHRETEEFGVRYLEVEVADENYGQNDT